MKCTNEYTNDLKVYFIALTTPQLRMTTCCHVGATVVKWVNLSFCVYEMYVSVFIVYREP